MAEVTVNLPAGSYGIIIDSGVIERLGLLLQTLGLQGKALVVSDQNVGPLYGEAALASLRRAGIMAEMVCVAAGEESKTLTVAESLYTKAITMGLDRQAAIIALGGGVVGDLAGFVAATYMRGVPFIQVPTTLLAQVDSSIGGKVAVNHQLGKNLIGAFYQPRLVVADTAVLATLPQRELSTGIAEVIKYGLIADAGFFSFIHDNQPAIMAKEPGRLAEVVRRSCEIKGRVVEQDEKETYLRMVLNFGHTIGHAVEADTGYSRYNHGEAVAIGMYGAALISSYLGLCRGETVEAVRNILLRFGLPYYSTYCQPGDLMRFLPHDKKSIGGAINWVLIKSVGQVLINNQVPDAIVRQALNDITEKAGNI